MMKSIEVVAAVIFDEQGRIFATPQETPQVSVRQQEQPTEHLETQSGWDKLKALFHRK